MKIVYIAKHNSGGNDEEGAISHALELLGHKVHRIHERKVPTLSPITGDLLLFHKWFDIEKLDKISIPKVFWYFDLVNSGDHTLLERDCNRKMWMRLTIPRVDLGFCTDGDFVIENRPETRSTRYVVSEKDGMKLHILRQGFDSRWFDKGVVNAKNTPRNDVFLPAIRRGGGVRREEFIDRVNTDYSGRITHRLSGAHGQELANLIANHKVVIAPDYPISDNYWSNRVYLILGNGGLLLHPYSKGLSMSFTSGLHILYYHDYESLQTLIEKYCECEEIRKLITVNAVNEVKLNHTYVHRCTQLLDVVKHRFGVS